MGRVRVVRVNIITSFLAASRSSCRSSVGSSSRCSNVVVASRSRRRRMRRRIRREAP